MIARAFHFGYRRGDGHCLRDANDHKIYEPHKAGIPWSMELMDTGLLKNGKRTDVPDGHVFWTCAKGDWLAFVWWDRSGDIRQNSNSGFYVQGFSFSERRQALDFACATFPVVIARQKYPLQLVDPT